MRTATFYIHEFCGTRMPSTVRPASLRVTGLCLTIRCLPWLIGAVVASHNLSAQPPVPMDAYLKQRLASPNDFRLSDCIFSRIMEIPHDDDVHLRAGLPKEQRVVFDVWGSEGIIGNGGFQYLFEHRFADCMAIADSYQSIGAQRAATAFREAAAIFPNSEAPADHDRRWQRLNRLGKRAQDILDHCTDEVLAVERQTQRLLAAYVRTHANAYAGLSSTKWEKSDDFDGQDSSPPPPDASVQQVASWLDSIEAECFRRDDLDPRRSPRASLPASGNPIVLVRLSDQRNSTDVELGTLATYAALGELRALLLHGTFVTEHGLRHVEKFPRLQDLRLSETDVRNSWLELLVPIADLRQLDLSDTSITDKGLTSVAKLGSIEELSLGGCNVTDRGLTKLASLSNLKSLDARRIGRIGSGLRELRGLPLEQIDLLASGVTDDDLDTIGNVRTLKSIRLADTRIGDPTLQQLAACRNLEELKLSGTNISNVGVRYLSPLTRLRYLDLSGTSVGDEGIRRMGQFDVLEELHLTSTRITNAGLEYLSQCTTLKSLGIGGNRIDGDASLRQLEVLTSLEHLSLPEQTRDGESVRYLRKQLTNTDFYFD